MKSDERGIVNIALKCSITICVTILIIFAINPININEIYNEYLKDVVAISTLGNSIGINENLDELESSQCITSVGAKIVDNLNIEINGFKIQVADSVFGYVNSSEERNEILEKVCLSYINELGIDSENVVKVYVNDNLESIPEKVDISKIETTGEIAEELYDAVVINDNLLNMKLEVINNSIESIEPSVIEEKCNELYMGETTIEEGESGEKQVYTKSYYNGIDKISENVIDEVIIKEAKPAIVKKGVKNPYYDGVKFLEHPLKDAWISSVFGEYRGNSYHKGVDLAENLGEAIESAYEGTVVFAGYNNGGYGNLVIIQHENNMETYYAHLNDIQVSSGEYVSKGQVIGTVGSTGYSTGAHLHFELRVGGTPVDPLNYILDT